MDGGENLLTGYARHPFTAFLSSSTLWGIAPPPAHQSSAWTFPVLHAARSATPRAFHRLMKNQDYPATWHDSRFIRTTMHRAATCRVRRTRENRDEADHCRHQALLARRCPR